MVEGITKTGFRYSIKKSSLNNYELVEILAEVDENPLLLPKLLNLLLGEEQKKTLMDHVRLEDKTVPTETLAEEIKDIFSGTTETKN